MGQLTLKEELLQVQPVALLVRSVVRQVVVGRMESSDVKEPVVVEEERQVCRVIAPG